MHGGCNYFAVQVHYLNGKIMTLVVTTQSVTCITLHMYLEPSVNAAIMNELTKAVALTEWNVNECSCYSSGNLLTHNMLTCQTLYGLL